ADDDVGVCERLARLEDVVLSVGSPGSAAGCGLIRKAAEEGMRIRTVSADLPQRSRILLGIADCESDALAIRREAHCEYRSRRPIERMRHASIGMGDVETGTLG